MKILALDTSTEACSVAYYHDGEIQQKFHHQPQQQAKLLLHLCDAILADHAVTLSALDAIVFCHGPGSFTGLRVATAAAQGLAVAQDIPLVTVSSLAMLAYGACRIANVSKANVVTCIDARMQEVYFAEYNIDANLAELVQAEQVIAPAQIAITANHETRLYSGNGWQAYQDKFTCQINLPTAMHVWPESQDMFVAALVKIENGETLEPHAALPNYIRNNVAKKTAEREVK